MKKLRYLHLLLWMYTCTILCDFSRDSDSECMLSSRIRAPSNNKERCPNVCSGSQCSSSYIQGFVQADLLHSNECISGCLVDDTYADASINYVIYVKNGTDEKIYLNITQDDNDSSLPHAKGGDRRKYQFALLSSKPVNWIVSYNKSSADYVFWTCKESCLESAHSDTQWHKIGQAVGETSMPKQLKQISCSCFDDTFGGKQCKLSAFLAFPTLSSLQISVGNTYRRATNCSTCNVHTDRFDGDKRRLTATSLSPLAPTESCSRRPAIIDKTRVFLVDVKNYTRNAVIHLELEGAFLLDSNTTVVFILQSAGNVRWIPFEGSGKDISGTFIFKTSDGSVVDTARLLTSSSGRLVAHEVLEAPTEDVSLLESIPSKYEKHVAAYSKFTNGPSYIRILVEEPSPEPQFELVTRLADSITCSSRDGSMQVTEEALQKFNYTLSDLMIGNCSSSNEYAFTQENLSKCGLASTRRGVLQIQASLRKSSFPLLCSYPNVELNIYENEITQEYLNFPVTVSDEKRIFYAKVSVNSDQMLDLLLLDHCYLASTAAERKYKLILNNVPVNSSTRIFTNYPPKQRKIEIFFSFSFRDLLAVHASGAFNLVCAFSWCRFQDESVSESVSQLYPPCPSFDGTDWPTDPPNDKTLTEIRKVGRFDLVREKSTDKQPSTASTSNGYALSFVLLLALGAFFMGILVVSGIWRISNHRSLVRATRLWSPGSIERTSYNRPMFRHFMSLPESQEARQQRHKKWVKRNLGSKSVGNGYLVPAAKTNDKRSNGNYASYVKRKPGVIGESSELLPPKETQSDTTAICRPDISNHKDDMEAGSSTTADSGLATRGGSTGSSTCSSSDPHTNCNISH